MTKNGHRRLVVDEGRDLLAQGENMDTDRALRYVLKVSLVQVEQLSEMQEQIQVVMEYQQDFPSVAWLMKNDPKRLLFWVTVIILVLYAILALAPPDAWREWVLNFIGL